MPIIPTIITITTTIMDIITRTITIIIQLVAAVLEAIRFQLTTTTILIMTVNHVTVMDTVINQSLPPLLLRTIAHPSFVLAHHHLLLLVVAAVVAATTITLVDATQNTLSKLP